MSFFGLDEGSKRERQYEKEVDDMKEEDFDDKLKKILRPAIINIQVSLNWTHRSNLLIMYYIM